MRDMFTATLAPRFPIPALVVAESSWGAVAAHLRHQAGNRHAVPPHSPEFGARTFRRRGQTVTATFGGVYHEFSATGHPTRTPIRGHLRVTIGRELLRPPRKNFGRQDVSQSLRWRANRHLRRRGPGPLPFLRRQYARPAGRSVAPSSLHGLLRAGRCANTFRPALLSVIVWHCCPRNQQTMNIW